MTTVVLYFFGVLGFLGAAYFGFQIGPSWRDPFQVYINVSAAIALTLQSVLLVAAGRAMEHLKTIAENSEYLHHLERLDPELAAELDEERHAEAQRRAERGGRGFLGFGRRSA